MNQTAGRLEGLTRCRDLIDRPRNSQSEREDEMHLFFDRQRY